MRLNDATPSAWDRVRDKQHTDSYFDSKIDEYMKAAEEEAAHSSWDNEVEDVVNNPDHYNTGAVECIVAIEESMSSVAFKGYLKGNCMKYLWRYDYKGKQVEDLQKAQWYLSRLTQVVVFENGDTESN